MLFMLVIYIPLVKITLIKNVLEKAMYILLLGTGIFITFMVCCYIFIGNFDEHTVKKMAFFMITIIFLPIIIYYSIKAIQYSYIYTWKFFVLCVYSFILIGLLFINKFIPNELLNLIMFSSMYIIPTFLVDIINIIPIGIIKRIIRQWKITVPICYLSLIYLILKATSKENKFKIIMWIIGISILGIILYNIIRNIIIKKLNNKDDEGNKIEKILQITSSKIIIDYMPILLFGINIILISTAMIPNITIISGRLIRSSIEGLPKDKIYYTKLDNEDDENIIVGNVVAQKDNLYYISQSPEMKIRQVKSNNISINPCENLIITKNCEDFDKINDNIIDVYRSLLTNSGFKIDKKIENISLNQYEYSYIGTIYLYKDSTVDFEKNYDWKLHFNINYSTDKDGIVSNIKTIFYSGYNNSSSNISNELLKKEFDNIDISFRKTYLEYFSLPTLTNENDRFYYTNGILYYNTYKSEYLANNAIEEYSFTFYDSN